MPQTENLTTKGALPLRLPMADMVSGDCGLIDRAGQPPYVKFRNDEDERTMIARIIGGERELFTNLVEPHRQMMLSTALKQMRYIDKAEDAVQESIYKALLRLHQFRGDSGFRTWLISIVINECRMQYRLTRRSGVRESVQKANAAPSNAPSVLEELLREENKRGIWSEIAKLPEKFRQVIVLRDLQNLSVYDTAAQLSLSVSAVKSRYLRAKRRLQRSTHLIKKQRTRFQSIPINFL